MTVEEYFRPHQCSEREANGDEDCTWCTGVMYNNAMHGANVRPWVRAEYEALRVAGGDGPAEKPGDGSNYGQLELGIIRRYGWNPHRVGPPGGAHVSFGTFWASLDPGMGAAVQGSMGVFPRNGHWRRWDPQFGGAHSVYVQREDSRDRVWWMNPSAPNSYAGEWMSKADLKRYYEGFSGGYLIGKIGHLAPPDTSTGEKMDAISLPQHPSIATATKATKLYPSLSATGTFVGTPVDIPAGHTKRYVGRPKGNTAIVIIGHDNNAAVEGKSGMFGRAPDWLVREQP